MFSLTSRFGIFWIAFYRPSENQKKTSCEAPGATLRLTYLQPFVVHSFDLADSKTNKQPLASGQSIRELRAAISACPTVWLLTYTLTHPLCSNTLHTLSLRAWRAGLCLSDPIWYNREHAHTDTHTLVIFSLCVCVCVWQRVRLAVSLQQVLEPWSSGKSFLLDQVQDAGVALPAPHWAPWGLAMSLLHSDGGVLATLSQQGELLILQHTWHSTNLGGEISKSTYDMHHQWIRYWLGLLAHSFVEPWQKKSPLIFFAQILKLSHKGSMNSFFVKLSSNQSSQSKLYLFSPPKKVDRFFTVSILLCNDLQKSRVGVI